MPLPWEECRSWQELLHTLIPSYPYTLIYPHISSFLHPIIHLVIPPSASIQSPIPNSHHLHHHTYPQSTIIGPSPPCISHRSSHSTSIHVLPEVPSSTSRTSPFPSLIRPGPPRWHHNSNTSQSIARQQIRPPLTTRSTSLHS